MHQLHLDNKENASEKLFEIEDCNKFIPRDQSAAASPSPAVVLSPPSPTSSPSREFSFAISLQPSATAFSEKSKGDPPAFAIDLSPADDIFFHGHLLPLHLLSHLPVSPCSSTNPFDSFPKSLHQSRDVAEQPKVPDIRDDGNRGRASSLIIEDDTRYSSSGRIDFETKGRSINSNSRSPSSVFGLRKWRKECEATDNSNNGNNSTKQEDKDRDREKSKKKAKFDVSHVLKKYMRMMQPLMFFKAKRDGIHGRRQVYSFSVGSLSMRNNTKEVLRGRRGEYSAPASMRTSPTNSGLLVESKAPPSSPNDSTMEELQAAIQAAIAHCKKSIETEKDKPFKDA